MYDKITVTGIIIASMPVGETDRRITILTQERGKISAFARGCRKPTSPLLACSQMFVMGDFYLYQGKDSYNLDSADVKNYFGDLKNDMTNLYYGVYVCEFAAYLCKENMPAAKELNLIFVTLRALEKNTISKKLIKYIYELRFLSEYGMMPQVFNCINCKTELIKLDTAYFSAKTGGIMCGKCRDTVDMVKIGHSSVYTLQSIISLPLNKLYSFTVDAVTEEEIRRVVVSFVKVHVGHDFKSEEMLDLI